MRGRILQIIIIILLIILITICMPDIIEPSGENQTNTDIIEPSDENYTNIDVIFSNCKEVAT